MLSFNRFFQILFVISVLMLVATNLYASPLATFKKGPLHVELDHKLPAASGNEVYQLRVRTDEYESVDIFDLKNPRRIVIDFHGVKKPVQSSIKVKQNSAVELIRLGKHPKKLRLVLDVIEPFQSSYSWTQTPDSLIMSLKSRRPRTKVAARNPLYIEQVAQPQILDEIKPPELLEARASAEIEMPKSHNSEITLPQDTAPIISTEDTQLNTSVENEGVPVLKEDLPRPIEPHIDSKTGSLTRKVILDRNESSTIEPKKHPVPAQKIEESFQVKGRVPDKIREREPQPKRVLPAITNASTQAIESIAFDYLPPNDIPVVRVQVTDKPDFSLVKKSSKEYQLRINNCTAGGQHNLLPYFPPQDFKGLLGLITKEVDDAVQVNIRVEPATRVNSFVRENVIYIRAFPVG